VGPGEAIRKSFEAWEVGDAEAVAGLFAEDGRYEDPLFPETLVGPEQIVVGVRAGMGEITDLEIPIINLVETGDVAIVEAQFLCKLAENGERFDFDFAMVVTMRDGKITRLTEYFDTHPFQS
jgi:ketosteroid isomerase-like protein